MHARRGRPIAIHSVDYDDDDDDGRAYLLNHHRCCLVVGHSNDHFNVPTVHFPSFLRVCEVCLHCYRAGVVCCVTTG